MSLAGDGSTEVGEEPSINSVTTLCTYMFWILDDFAERQVTR
jgi:hypothetical protein